MRPVPGIVLRAALVLLIGAVASAPYACSDAGPTTTSNSVSMTASSASQAVTSSTAGTETAAGAGTTTSAPAPVRVSPTAPASQPASPPGSLPASLPVNAPVLKVPILMYHFVDSSPPPAGRWAAGLTVATGQFQRQMDYLSTHGYHPVTLRDIYLAMAGQEALPANPVAITFDDGNKDNFTAAFPILRAHGFVATFFVITGFVGNNLSMSWGDLTTMQAAGMAIESHTFDHKDLRGLDPTTLDRELAGSRAAILEHLGEDPVVLCYPAGKCDTTVLEAARVAGYLMAVTTQPGKTLDAGSRYRWPRVRVNGEESLETFVVSLE
jgi:peptidoglycan/xylan/chitin deacetylase (PgdA/CDA1 family)